MKILYLAVGVHDKGGIARYSRYQIQALRELLGRQNVVVLSLLGTGQNDFEDAFSVDYNGGGIGLRSEAVFFLECIRRCLSVRPAVVWSSHVRFLPNILSVSAAFSGVRTATNVYGEELWSGRRLAINRRLLPRANLVVSDCHFAADFIERDYSIKRQRVRILWDCVDLSRFRLGKRRNEMLSSLGVPIGSRNRYVLTLGRIEKRSRYKGFDRLLDAFVRLREQRDLICLIAGDGDDRSRLERRVREENLAERVFFLGSVHERELADVYNLCDLFVLVSDRGEGRGEGIPLTVLEAAACGKPTIVGDEDGSRESVVDGISGLIVSPRKPEALVQAISRLTLDDTLRERMGHAARRRIETEFSYEGFREKTGDLLEELAAQTGRGI